MGRARVLGTPVENFLLRLATRFKVAIDTNISAFHDHCHAVFLLVSTQKMWTSTTCDGVGANGVATGVLPGVPFDRPRRMVARIPCLSLLAISI
jgi:hypothetical protein